MAKYGPQKGQTDKCGNPKKKYVETPMTTKEIKKMKREFADNLKK
jgi:hypothetical protein